MLKKIKAADKKVQKEVKERFGKKGVRLYKDVRDDIIKPKTVKDIFTSFTSGMKQQKQISGIKKVRTTYHNFTIATMNGICCCMKLYLWSEEDLQWLEERVKTKAAEILTLVNSGKMDSMDVSIGEQFIINSMITAAGLTTTEQKVYENFSHDEPIDLFIERKKLQMAHVEESVVVEEETIEEEKEKTTIDFEAERKERSLNASKEFANVEFGERTKEAGERLSQIINAIECGEYDNHTDAEFYSIISVAIKNLSENLIYDVDKISKVTDINTDINTPQGHATMTLINKYMSTHPGNHLFKTIIYHTGEMFLVAYDVHMGLINDVIPLNIYEDKTCDTGSTTSESEKDSNNDNETINRGIISNEERKQIVAKLVLSYVPFKERKLSKVTIESLVNMISESIDDGIYNDMTEIDFIGAVFKVIKKFEEEILNTRVSSGFEAYEESFDDGKFPAKKGNKKRKEEGK